MEDRHVAGYFVPRGTAYSSMHGPYNVTQMSGPSRPIFAGAISNHQCGHGRKGPSYESLPFGSQDDRAPGVGPALQVMHLTLARILQAFELKTLSNVGVDLEECSGILLSMMHSLQLWCLRRKVRKITKSSSFNGNKKYAPEPPGAWPIIGHLPLLVSPSDLIGHLPHLRQVWPAFMLRMGMTSPMLIVKRERLLKNVTLAKDHAVTIAGKLMAYDHSVMGFTPFGTYWREIRKIATVELFSARRIGMLKPVRHPRFRCG
ncbi:hypothetical protein Syun_031460 [Stephania yunnanensis]|uniref:Cytochrome P450 n=1 Tax=Stephania yunnanensis TaxID=152371 RepID=A0AAP0DVZ0_9MAGN